MLVHEFDELMEVKPFVPFEIVTADGRAVRIKSPEYAWRTPNMRTIIAYSPDMRMHMIDLQLVTMFVREPEGNGRGKKRGK